MWQRGRRIFRALAEIETDKPDGYLGSCNPQPKGSGHIHWRESRVVSEHYREEQKDWIIYLRLADAVLELFIKQGCPKRPGWPGQEAYGLRHLSFRVPSVEDTVKELHAAGIETEPIRKDIFTGERRFAHRASSVRIACPLKKYGRFFDHKAWKAISWSLRKPVLRWSLPLMRWVAYVPSLLRTW